MRILHFETATLRIVRPLARLVLPLACALACTPDGDDPVLSDRSFVSAEIEGRELVGSTRIELDFHDDGSFEAWAGCNAMSSFSYDVSRGVLDLGSLFSTDADCSAELIEQDEWLSEFLDGKPTVDLDGNQLDLSDDVVTIVFFDEYLVDQQ